MIGEERQASFKAQYNQFGINMRMSSEEVLSIAVENTQTLERYSRDISQEYISQQDTSFQKIFEEPKDVIDYLRTGTNEVVVDGQFLVFNYRHRNNRVKRIKFQLIREDIDRVELTNRKMEKMQESFTNQLLQKDIEIKQLKQKYEEMTQILQGIKGEIRAEKANTRELTETLRATNEKIQAIDHSLVPVEESKQIIRQSSDQVKVFSKIDHHPNNVHKEYYTLKNLTATLTRITRIGKDCKWYNFVNKCEVLPNQKAKYSLAISKTANSNIMVGFCTEKGLGNINNYSHAEAAYYNCSRHGYLWLGGSGKQISVGTVAGETVECVAELASCKLSWWKEGSQIAQCAVPAAMRNKPIFISILLSNTGDEVDLCVCSKIN